MVLQPSDERRRSGLHYTPRSLTEPIVRKALEPVLKRLGGTGVSPVQSGSTGKMPVPPTPDQILDLKICDPAMGSGAFLVEACRQLGDELVKAWHVHRCPPKLPPDEDEVLHARRLVSQRCLYGVDKNPMAVDLANDFQNELAFLGIESSPSFVREPQGNGCAERFIRTLKENLLWVRYFRTVEELRLALLDFQHQYNHQWLIERHGYRTPAAVRQSLTACLEPAA